MTTNKVMVVNTRYVFNVDFMGTPYTASNKPFGRVAEQQSDYQFEC